MKKSLFLSLISLIFITLGVFLTYGFLLAGVPEISTLPEAYELLPQANVFTDRHGTFLEARGKVIRTIETQNILSANLSNALLAAQDCLDYPDRNSKKRLSKKIAPMMRVAYKELTPGTLRYKLWNKAIIKDLQKLPDDDLLNLFFNSIQFSANHFGIEQAAWQFFGIETKDIDFNQALLLAALSMRPELDPAVNEAEILPLMNIIYQRLAQKLMLSLQPEVPITIPRLSNSAWQRATLASPITNLAMRTAFKALRQHDRADMHGLKITTTLDLPLQTKAETILETAIAQRDIVMGSIVVIDLKNSHNLVMAEARIGGGGSTGHLIMDSYPPGSIIKPFTYLAAIREDFTAVSMISNSENSKPDLLAKFGAEYHSFKGQAPLRISLTRQMNRSWINLAAKLDLEHLVSLYKQLGFTPFNESDTYSLSDILGFKNIPFIDLVNGYSVFAKNGIFTPSNAFITVNKGDTTLESTSIVNKVVVNSASSYIISEMLKDEIDNLNTTADSKYFSTFRAKAGSSADNKNSYFIGYNGQVIIAVHVVPPPDQKIILNGHNWAGPIWAQMVQSLPEEFLTIAPEHPFGANCVAVDPMSGGRMDQITTDNYLSCFIPGTEPTHEAPAKRQRIPDLPLD